MSSSNYNADRQRRLRYKRLSEGKCGNCGAKRNPYSSQRCDNCLLKQRKQRQKREGYQPKKDGGKGRNLYPKTHAEES